MERRTPEYIECARNIMRDHFDAIPHEFNVRVLASRMKEHTPAMITNALRHLETSGIVHAPGGKTYDGATGRRKVAVMVWRKGAATGPKVVARKGGESHVPPSEALKRLGLPSPHDKAAEIQLCVVHKVPLENIAGSNEQPVLYVPRAWLDERAPETVPDPAATVEAEANVLPVEYFEDFWANKLTRIEAHLQTLVNLAQRGQIKLPL